MTNTELLTIIISTGALTLSFGTLYLQFIHKKTAIVGRLLSVNYRIPSDKDYDRALEYSICNIGNQEILLNDIEFVEGKSSQNCAENGCIVHKYECGESPCVLKPGEIKLLTFYTKIKKSKKPKGDYKKMYFSMFVFASVKGKIMHIYHDITALNTIKSEDKVAWNSFTLNNATEEI